MRWAEIKTDSLFLSLFISLSFVSFPLFLTLPLIFPLESGGRLGRGDFPAGGTFHLDRGVLWTPGGHGWDASQSRAPRAMGAWVHFLGYANHRTLVPKHFLKSSLPALIAGLCFF